MAEKSDICLSKNTKGIYVIYKNQVSIKRLVFSSCENAALFV